MDYNVNINIVYFNLKSLKSRELLKNKKKKKKGGGGEQENWHLCWTWNGHPEVPTCNLPDHPHSKYPI